MVTVVVPGIENQRSAEALCRALEKFGGALYVSSDSVLDFSAGSPAFLVFCADRVQNISTKQRLLLLPASTNPKRLAEADRDFDRILTDGLPGEQTDESLFLSVGTGRSCQISVASAAENALQVSVQKMLRTLDGAQILPCEFSVRYQGTDAHTALFAFAVLLLTGKADPRKLELQL